MQLFCRYPQKKVEPG